MGTASAGDLARLCYHHGTPPGHRSVLSRLLDSKAMSWQQSKGSPQWSYWRGATRPPWKQLGKGAHQKGHWEEKPAGMQFPAYDSKGVNKTGLMKEVHSTTYVQDPLVSELQRAVNTARRAEGKVRKLETDKVARKQMEEDFYSLLGGQEGAGQDQGEGYLEDQDEVIRRALASAPRDLPPPSNLTTPQRRTGVPPMTPVRALQEQRAVNPEAGPAGVRAPATFIFDDDDEDLEEPNTGDTDSPVYRAWSSLSQLE